MTRPTKAKAMERLRKVLGEIPKLKRLSYDSPQFEGWKIDTGLAISNAFGDDSAQIHRFNNINYNPTRTWDTPDEVFLDMLSMPSVCQEAYVRGLELAASFLESMIKEIEEYWEDDNQITSSSTRREKQQDEEQPLKSSGALRNDPPSSNKVFVIHGGDNGTKQTVARFLERLSLKPVILHEQPNEGRTIIEKFEDHADVRFAVALLTPDDVGSLKEERNNLNPRARQNVIFEFGYFIGKLGRERVCALVKGDVEKPSDYDGVLYISLDDSDGWKMGLIKELKSAGFQLDANRAFQA
ncbi:MAG: nucleotide-binding protein [Nitrospira sp.]|nr:nucleotide-binding protein [Nitrospira sp.]